MLRTVDANTTKGTYITFRFERLSESGKTKRWVVESAEGQPIAYVEWGGHWRKYIFFPLSCTIFEEVCLREIADFIQGETKAHRARKAR